MEQNDMSLEFQVFQSLALKSLQLATKVTSEEERCKYLQAALEDEEKLNKCEVKSIETINERESDILKRENAVNQSFCSALSSLELAEATKCDLEKKLEEEKIKTNDRKKRFQGILAKHENKWTEYEEEYSEFPLAKKRQELWAQTMSSKIKLAKLRITTKKLKNNIGILRQITEKRKQIQVVEMAKAYSYLQKSVVLRKEKTLALRVKLTELANLKEQRQAELNNFNKAYGAKGNQNLQRTSESPNKQPKNSAAAKQKEADKLRFDFRHGKGRSQFVFPSSPYPQRSGLQSNTVHPQVKSMILQTSRTFSSNKVAADLPLLASMMNVSKLSTLPYKTTDSRQGSDKKISSLISQSPAQSFAGQNFRNTVVGSNTSTPATNQQGFPRPNLRSFITSAVAEHNSANASCERSGTAGTPVVQISPFIRDKTPAPKQTDAECVPLKLNCATVPVTGSEGHQVTQTPSLTAQNCNMQTPTSDAQDSTVQGIDHPRGVSDNEQTTEPPQPPSESTDGNKKSAAEPSDSISNIPNHTQVVVTDNPNREGAEKKLENALSPYFKPQINPQQLAKDANRAKLPSAEQEQSDSQLNARNNDSAKTQPKSRGKPAPIGNRCSNISTIHPPLCPLGPKGREFADAANKTINISQTNQSFDISFTEPIGSPPDNSLEQDYSHLLLSPPLHNAQEPSEVPAAPSGNGFPFSFGMQPTTLPGSLFGGGNQPSTKVPPTSSTFKFDFNKETPTTSSIFKMF